MYGKSLIDDRFFPIFFNFAPRINIIMKYTEVKFECIPDSQTAREVLMAMAAEVGFESFVDEDDSLNGYIQTEQIDKEEIDRMIADFPMEGTIIKYVCSEMEDKDWNEEWEKGGFDPIWIEDKCVIYNANSSLSIPEPKDSPAHVLKIAIDAKMAFGTGNHETTRMIVGYLLEHDMTGKRVIDCGCGTGILSIVAKKMGAEEVVSYDIDEWSVENTQHNAELNNVELEVLEGDKNALTHVNGLFDVVMANINRNILLDDMQAYEDVMQHDGIMILSGFYEQDAPILLERAEELGLKEKMRLISGDWCCLVLSH